MPQVPYNPIQTVMPDQALGYQRIEANPEAFGAGAGRATQGLGGQVEQVGDVLARHAEIFRKQQDEASVDESNTAFQQGVRDILFGNQTTPGFYSLRGKDAMTAMNGTASKIEELRQATRDGMPSKEQQKMFDYITRRATERDLYSMSSHAATENRNWLATTAEGSINSEVNNSSSYWNDDSRFALSLGNIKIQAEKLAGLKGIDPQSEAGKAIVTHYQSEAWVARLKGIGNLDPTLAKRVFDDMPDGAMDVAHKAQMQTYLDNRILIVDRAKEAEAARVEARAAREEKKAVEQTQLEIVKKLQSKTLTASDIINSNLPAHLQEHYLDVLRIRSKESTEESHAKANQRITQELYAGIVNGTVTEPSQILSRVKADGGLDINHAPMLVKMLEQAQAPGGLKYGHLVVNAARTATKIMSGEMGLVDKEAIPGAINSFAFELGDRINAAVAAGKDPRLLVDPTKPENMLRPEILKQFLPAESIDIGAASSKIVASRAAKGKIGGTLPEAVNPKTGERLVLRDGKWQKP